MTVLDIPYKPRPLQQRLHDSRKRFTCLVCHRRFGKTVWAVNELIKTAVTTTHPSPIVAYVAPTYSQAKRVAWGYVKQFTEPLAKAGRAKYWDTELKCEIDRGKDKATIYLLGAENPDAIRGMYLDGCVLDEYANMDPRLWGEIVRPAVSDRKGWVVWIGTPAGHNHLYDLYKEAVLNMTLQKEQMKDWDKTLKRINRLPEQDQAAEVERWDRIAQKTRESWYATLLRASETDVVDELELMDARQTMSDSQYMQEYECDFAAALEGAYYAELMADASREGRITAVPYQTTGEVYTAWDLGMDDYTAIWFAQMVGGEIHLVDYYENQGEGLEHYVEIVKARPYNYAGHYLPHDTMVREMSTGRSRLETLQGMGLQATVVPKLRIEDGISAVRAILSRCWFDARKCFFGIECLRQYSRVKHRQTLQFLPKAKHDKFCHGADAFRTLATGIPDFDPRAYEVRQRYSSKPERRTSWMSA